MRIKLLAAGLGLAAFAAFGAKAAEPSTADQLIAVDKAFEAYVAEHGVAQGFKSYMDPKDGLEFAGGEPKRGAEAIFQAEGGDKPPTSKLTWTPTEAFASKSGDMGVTWGRWTETPNDTTKKPFTGRYVTVWRKDAEGHWKGLIDIGTPD
ncbi:YybH family protein [Phenylobacterium montanum]|uniref:Nuclear transport factor 2 family protein n=1 Tax=Phenylobacterium montanum TaxID=2823693 RepID=A0A975IUT2_9CAUL|nr:nuclear transport factor 2 family protein [Caulobacter sp. S6]QUD88080.1 nuclear transport factor 2 family protein [Caulobacter sp. S6]